MADRLEAVVRVVCALCDGEVDNDDLTVWINRVLTPNPDGLLADSTERIVAALAASRSKPHSAGRGKAASGTGAGARRALKRPRTTT